VDSRNLPISFLNLKKLVKLGGGSGIDQSWGSIKLYRHPSVFLLNLDSVFVG